MKPRQLKSLREEVVRKEREELEMARVLDAQWREPKLGFKRIGSPFEDKAHSRLASRRKSQP